MRRFLRYSRHSTRRKTIAKTRALANAEPFGTWMVPELFLVAEAATLVVTVETCGATVVPGTVVRASATTVPTVLPPVVVVAEMVVEMTEGGTVVPGTVVVYVIS